MTNRSIQLLSELTKLEPEEAEWALRSALQGGVCPELARRIIDEANFHFQNQGEKHTGEQELPIRYKKAEARLLDDPGLTGSDKALLAAVMVSDLKEENSFSAREITENLRKNDVQIANTTTALNTLIQRKQMAVVRISGDGPKAQKRYELTDLGFRTSEQLLTPKSPSPLSHARR